MPSRPLYFLARERSELAHGVVLEPGDVLRYDPSNNKQPYSLHRGISVMVDPGAILAGMEDGSIESFGITHVSSSLPSSSPRSLLLLHPRSRIDSAG